MYISWSQLQGTSLSLKGKYHSVSMFCTIPALSSLSAVSYNMFTNPKRREVDDICYYFKYYQKIDDSGPFTLFKDENEKAR